MDFELSEQERMLQRTAREFARNSVQPQAADIDFSGEFPFELASAMGNLGLLGLPYPADYGGSGAGYIGYALVIEQLCQASMTVGAIVAVDSLSEESIFRFGDEKQKRRYLTPLTEGKFLGCFAFTEPATGSDPRALETRARPQGKDYVLTGQKSFIALSPAAYLAIVFARDETDRISAFIAETSSPGFVLREPCQTMGLRGLGASVIYLDDVRVPKENMIGEKGKGFDVLLEAISVERLGVAAQSTGVAQAALDLSIDYAREREALGKPIAELPTIQWLLAEMASRIEPARWLTYRTAFLRDRNADIRYESSVAKLFTSQAAVEVTRMAMQVHGSYGTMKTLPVERLYRDAKMAESYVGVSEIQRVLIASYLIQ